MRRLALTALLFPMVASAVPATFTHQGRLLDSTGAPLDGTVDVTFALFDEASSGNELWSEAHSLIVDNGFFTAQLGTVSSTPLDASLLDGEAAWLQLTVDGTALPDRIALNSVPYAIRASHANVATDVRGGTVEAESITSTGAISAGSLEVNGTTIADDTGLIASVAWGNLTDVPADLADGDDDSFASLSCSDGEILKWSNGAFTCGEDVDTNTDTDTFGEITCSDGEILKWSGGAFTCADDATIDLSQSVSIGGRVAIGDDGADCDSTTVGSLRVNANENNALEFCDGETWSRIAGGALGSNANNPGNSCKAILDSGTSSGDGVYWIDPKNTGTPFEVYCDMTTDGGGWTRFWWFEAGQDLNGVTDVLSEDLNDCDASSGRCLAIMPITNPTELHVQNDENNWATWTFNSTNTSEAMKAAFTARTQTTYADGRNRQAFNATRQSGGFNDTPYRCDESTSGTADNCDSFWYALHNDVVSFYLDDDGGWAETAFGAGRDNAGILGVDSFEPSQRYHALDRSLWLYYR